MKLKYGLNPNQLEAELIFPVGKSPLEILNGNPGYINFLDALYSWQLVRELSISTKLPSAASYKHVNPSGVGTGVKLNDLEKKSFMIKRDQLSPLAAAYCRARGTDRQASFGDFIALSDPVDEITAKVIKQEMSNGIIAPGYSPKAMEILSSKQKGKYYPNNSKEVKEVFGFRLTQHRNTIQINQGICNNIVTTKKNLPAKVIQNIIVGLICLKYTHSNSSCICASGQTIGISAGQQSRIESVHLAIKKASKFILRQSREIINTDLSDCKSRTEKDNQIISLIESTLRETNHGKEIVKDYMKQAVFLTDGFFPQIDSIELIHKHGIKYIVQPGGSINDSKIIDLCEKYGITMIFTGFRLFHH